MFKSRLWILVVVIAPLLIIFLVGIAFDNLNEYRINIGVYSTDYTELTNSFISKLNRGQFRTIKTKSAEECIDNAKIGLSHTCVIFPSNLALGAKNKDVFIYIDYSKLNLAWIVRDRLFSRVEERSTEITRQLTQNILSKLIFARDEISSDMQVVIAIKLNELNITNKTAEVYLFVSGINTTVGLNQSDMDRLATKISSLKATNDIIVSESEGVLEFAESLVKNGDFSSSQEDGYLSGIRRSRTKIQEQQKYIENLFNPQNSASLNKTMEDILSKINSVNKNANTTAFIVLKSKSNLYEANRLTASNIKLINRLVFSMDNIKKELYNIDELTAEDIASPVVAEIKPLTEYNTYLNYLFPTLMALAIMFAAMYLSAIVVVMELNTPAFFRNFISPTNSFVFFFASYLTNLSLVGVQTLTMIVISMVFFFFQVISNILTTLIICFLIATFFIILGMGIGYLFKTEQMSILAATFTTSIFLFLSNVLLPIENMPEFFMNIVKFNPFLISVSLLRKSILFRQSVVQLNEEILYLVIFIIGLLILYAAVYFTISNKKFKKQLI